MPAFAPASRLLVVEDDAELLSIVQETLEEEGYGVTPATSLPDSLRALEQQLFRFVLTDLFYESRHAPFQSIQPLIAQAAPIPVGVMTAWPNPDEALAQTDLAFLLHKPFDLDDLQRRVHAHVHPRVSRPHQLHLVEAFFAALATRNWTRLAHLCTPDVSVFSLAAPAVALSDSQSGLLSLRGTWEERFQRLPGFTIEEVAVFPRQNGAAARYLARWQGSDGIPHRVAGSMHFRLQGERIVQIEGAF